MVLFAGKLYKRVSLFTLSLVLAISGLVVAVPLYFSQVAHATGPLNWTVNASFVGGNCTKAIKRCKTIQKAVNAATSGDTIIVVAGSYTEVGQIVIDKNLSIVGANEATTIIKTNQDTTNGGDSKGWFLVNAGITFNMSNVTLDGTGYKIFQGIRDYGKGTIDNVNFVNIKYNESGGDYAGTAVVAFGGTPSTPMNVDITNSEFSGIGRVGVLYYGTGITDSTYNNNTYTGKGAYNWLDYAVEVGAGANATISNSIISGNTGVTTSDNSTSAGVIVTTYYGSGTTKATITGNTISNSTDGIGVGYDGSDTSIVVAHNNNLSGNAGTGITSTSSSIVDATNNWWGNASGPGDVGHGTGDKVSTNVDYKPWCTDLGCTTFSSDSPTTTAATVVTSTTATLNGIVGTSNAGSTSFWWGTTSAGSFTNAVDPSSQLGGWSYDTDLESKLVSAPFSHDLTGLTPGTTYYFVAWSSVDGTWYPGTILHFTTADKYTQAEFKAFDGVNTGTDSYTASSDIAATYIEGTGTESNPVKLTLTGYAPIVTPWFNSSRTTDNYVTIGIKLPTDFTGINIPGGTAVYKTGFMNTDGIWAMSDVGNGSTPLAIDGAAHDYLDFSFGANRDYVKSGLFNLEVIWNADSAPEYFTIDVNGLQLAPDVPIATLTANGISVPKNGYTNSNTFTFNLSSADATRYQLKYWNDIVSSRYKEGTPWNSMTLGAVYPDSFTQGEGTHYFAFSACNAGGNAADNCSAYSSPFKVTYDKTAPAVPGNPSPTNQSYVNTHDFTFSWDAVSDPSTPVSYEWEFSYGTTVKDDGSFTSRSGFHSLTSASVNSPGTPDNIYYWHVRAIDSLDNASAWSSTWKVTIDTTAPVIALQGANPQTIERGTSYNELRATVSDTTDSGLVATIDASNVNTSVLGTYTVKYDAVDTAGNPATQVTRTVNVVDTTPKITTPLVPNNGDATASLVATTSTSTLTTPVVAPQFTDAASTPVETVLGDQASQSSTTNDNSTTGTDIKGVSDTKNDNTVWSIFGLAWYWWLAILAAGGLIIWRIVASAIRNNDNQNS